MTFQWLIGDQKGIIHHCLIKSIEKELNNHISLGCQECVRYVVKIRLYAPRIRVTGIPTVRVLMDLINSGFIVLSSSRS